jgi:hypothetical protein
MEDVLEKRIKSIEKKIEEQTENIQNAKSLYEDETRLRKIIADNILPIITVSKENMVTNFHKI